MLPLVNYVTVIGLFLLSYSVALVKSADPSGTAHNGGPEIHRITDRNIHEKLAVDVIREEHFNIPPGKVSEMVQAAGNTVVVAPDPHKGHPNLFHMSPQRYQIMLEDGLANPKLTVVVLRDTVAVSYRDNTMTKWKIPKEALKDFCNSWNENVKVGTCFVDYKDKVVLQYDIQSVNSPQESTDHMVDSFNRILLDKGLHEFQLSLQRFSKKLINTLILKNTGPNAAVHIPDTLKKTLQDHVDGDL